MIHELTYSTALTVVMGWTVAGLVLSVAKTFHADLDRKWLQGARAIWAELKPFYLPAYGYWLITNVLQGQVLGVRLITLVCGLLNWYFYRNLDDDDRWKRRKARAVEKIKRMGGRLVAVPVNR